MTASLRDVKHWLKHWLKDAIAKRKKNPNVTHLIVGLDPFDYDNSGSRSSYATTSTTGTSLFSRRRP